MTIRPLIFLPLAVLAFSQPILAATLFTETFTNATAPTATQIVGDAGQTWNSVANRGNATLNPDTPTGALSVSGTNDYGILTAVMPNKTTNTSWQGVQINRTVVTTAQNISSYALTDLVFSMRLKVTSTGTPTGPGVGIQLRQPNQTTDGNNITHIYQVVPTGDWQTVTFSLNTRTQTGFTAFNATDNISLYLEVANAMAVAGSTNTITFEFDNITITAVPEPAAAMLGFAALPLLMRRRRAQ